MRISLLRRAGMAQPGRLPGTHVNLAARQGREVWNAADRRAFADRDQKEKADGMSGNSGGDAGLYVIVGALVVVVVAVFVILSGLFPLYGDQRVEVRVQTPRAELVVPRPPAEPALPRASFA